MMEQIKNWQKKVIDAPEGYVAIQRDVDRLEKWVDRNFLKFNEGKAQAVHLRMNNSIHQYMLGGNQLESSLAEENPGS